MERIWRRKISEPSKIARALPTRREIVRPSAVKAPLRHVRSRVTMNMDADIVEYFKEQAAKRGRSYQLLMNEVLRSHMEEANGTRRHPIVDHLLENESFLEAIAHRIDNMKKKAEDERR